jgi:hypothetical protein
MFVRSATVAALAALSFTAACSSAPVDSVEQGQQAYETAPPPATGGKFPIAYEPPPVCRTPTGTVNDPGCSVAPPLDLSLYNELIAAGYSCSNPQMYKTASEFWFPVPPLHFMTCKPGMPRGGNPETDVPLSAYLLEHGAQNPNYTGNWGVGMSAIETNGGAGVCTACLGPAPSGSVYVFWVPEYLDPNHPIIGTCVSCMTPQLPV